MIHPGWVPWVPDRVEGSTYSPTKEIHKKLRCDIMPQVRAQTHSRHMTRTRTSARREYTMTGEEREREREWNFRVLIFAQRDSAAPRRDSRRARSFNRRNYNFDLQIAEPPGLIFHSYTSL